MEMEMERVREEEEEEEEEEEMVKLAERHLELRNYGLSRHYSLELLSSSAPTRRCHRATATLILTISDILSSVPGDHYSVLQLDSLSDDPNLIRTHFKKLSFILNLNNNNNNNNNNTSSLARDALVSVEKAFSCLSDPLQKSLFDARLRSRNSFWTFCPYCFYLYEYHLLYQDCCLRCHNSVCRRAFQAVVLTTLPFFDLHLNKVPYFGCFAYFPMAFQPPPDQMSNFRSWSRSPPANVFPPPPPQTNGHVNDTSNDESDQGIKPHSNVHSGIPLPHEDTDRPRGMRRKSVARKKRRINHPHDFANAFQQDEGPNVGDLDEAEMSFFQGDGDIFVTLRSNDTF